MKDIKEVYPMEEGDRVVYASDYTTLLESFEYEILIQVDDSDYQGDSRVLFVNGDQYGYLLFGWGSCSGCDSLQACSNYSELGALQHELHDSIMWLSCAEMLKYFNEHDWEGDYSYHSAEQAQFIERVKSILEGNCG